MSAFLNRLVVFLIFSAASPLTLPPAAGAAPSFQASLSAQEIVLDQTCELKIQVQWPVQEGQYRFAVPDPEVRNLRIKRRGEAQETLIQEGAEWMRKTFVFELEPLQAGASSVAELNIQYVEASSQIQGRLSVPPMSIKVVRPFPFRPSPVWLAAPAVIFGGAAAAFFIGIRRFKQKREPQSQNSNARLLEKIETLRRQMKGAGAKALTHELGREFRSFLLSYYKLNPAASTEDELAEEVQKQPLSLDEQRVIAALLAELREAKFVQKEPASGHYDRLATDILEFVKKRQVILSS